MQAGGQQPAAQPPAPAAPGSATNDFPAAGPTVTEQQRLSAVEILRAFLSFGGKSTGADSTGSSEGSDAEASDGGGELAQTGIEASAFVGLSALALLGGAGMLWYARRRRS